MRHWYRRDALAWLLAPLGLIYCAVAVLRRHAYRVGWLRSTRLSVPVIVVGNISVGGTGKTPLVIWLVEWLRSRGHSPGIISRGYGGKAPHWPQAVTPASDPRQVGDEPVLMASRCGCPVYVAPVRVDAGRALLAAHPDCDLLVADDGLQHYALARDIEIAVVDGARRHGNGWCLPAGPLREPVSRLATVDVIVCNGAPVAGEYGMRLSDATLSPLSDPHDLRPLSDLRGQRVHAVCGIGNPERFFGTLRELGLDIVPHAFPDHHAFTVADIDYGDGLPVLMTEKDAVKCRGFAGDVHYAVAVNAQPDDALSERLSALLARRLHG